MQSLCRYVGTSHRVVPPEETLRRFSPKLSDGVGASSAPADAAEGGAKARSSATLREVLRRLAEIYGEAFKKRVFDGSAVNEFVNISLNGRLIDDLDVEVRGGDEIIILSVISGG